jgi:four helix bundle protein
MQIKRFEEIEAWKAARAMTKMVYTLTGDVFFEKDFGLASQIQRATVSVMSNIAEGFDSGSKSEFVRFLGYARRSASEVQSHLYAAIDQRYINEKQFEEVYGQAETVRKLISAFLRYLRSSGAHQPANRLTGKLANTS